MSSKVKIAAMFAYVGLAMFSSFLAILPLFPAAFVSSMDHGASIPMAFLTAWGLALMSHPAVIFFMIVLMLPYFWVVKWMVKFSETRNKNS